MTTFANWQFYIFAVPCSYNLLTILLPLVHQFVVGICYTWCKEVLHGDHKTEKQKKLMNSTLCNFNDKAVDIDNTKQTIEIKV